MAKECPVYLAGKQVAFGAWNGVLVWVLHAEVMPNFKVYLTYLHLWTKPL
jgi:hypothetical protein